MRIAYSAWGFVGDGVIDSPDGGRLTRSLFIENLIKAGHEIIWVQQNRDVDEHREPLFDANKHYDNEQWNTLCKLQYSKYTPDIDILFVEWRWRIPGRNCEVDITSDKYTPDLDRQKLLIDYYASINVKIIIWDKDEKMTEQDESYICQKRYSYNRSWYPNNECVILSPALFPQSYIIERKTLLFPCNLDKIRGTQLNNQSILVGYVGSQYERDEQIYKYINPVSFKYPEGVVFAGNWMKYPELAKRNQINFPCINFKDRLLPKDMGQVYSYCMTCVLLCKSNYANHGHITQRIHEVASFGSIGIGLKEQDGIDKFIIKENIISDAYDLIERLGQLKHMNRPKRQDILDQQIEMLDPFDIKNVMKEFEKIINVPTI